MIEEYSFGRMVINGQEYTGDLLIAGGTVMPSWWRKEGHSLVIEDLDALLSSKPSVLVIGTGAYGMMRTPRETLAALEAAGIRIEAMSTDRASKTFNELSRRGERVAGAFHLTC
jgi:hypothetical protein